MRESLEDLKVGDLVIYNGYYHEDIRTVDRITPTQIVAGKTRFRRKDGLGVGEQGWRRTSIERPTPERLIKVETKMLQREVPHLVTNEATKLSLNTLRTIKAVVQADKESRPKT